MEHSSTFAAIGPLLQICLIDLLLSGDNAVVIALACRGLRPALWRKVVLLGTLGAVVLRVALTALATLVLQVPYLKLVGAVLLVAIAIQLIAEDPHPPGENGSQQHTLWTALTTILVADTVMSLDNVLAVAAASRGSFVLLAFGLLLSIPILIFGSIMVSRILDRYPALVLAGGGVLGWVAGATAASDPAVEPWLQSQSFGLAASAPLIGAVYVMLQGSLARRRPTVLAPAAASSSAAAPMWKAPAQAAVAPADRAALRAAPAPSAAVSPVMPPPPASIPPRHGRASEVSSAPEPAQTAAAEGSATRRDNTGRRTDLIITAAVLIPLALLILIVYFVAWTIRHH